MSVRLMKRIADNPHDEHLGAEIAEGGDFLSSKAAATQGPIRISFQRVELINAN